MLNSRIKLGQVANIKIFLDALEKRTQNALASSPSDISLLNRLAEIYRQQGRLDDALTQYKKLLTVDPTHDLSRLMVQVLGQQALSSVPAFDKPSPVPFVHLKDFLNASEFDKIWSTVEAHSEQFSTSLTGGGQELDVRRSNSLKLAQLDKFRTAFLQKIVEQLPFVFPRIGVRPFNVGRREIQLTMHLNGDFFHVHRDSSVPEEGVISSGLVTRQVTYVYYFHRQPKQFDGGDLLLFDSDLQRDAYTQMYTRVSPIHNSVILFPSSAYHQVSPVQLNSDDYRGGRFTVNGWLHPKKKAP